MLSNIRNFSKTIYAKILLAIIIIPFVFWGMGGIFNSGNSNNIVKINNHNIFNNADRRHISMVRSSIFKNRSK